MPDREKVIKQIEVDIGRANRTGEMFVYVGRKTATDALALLKAQEPIEARLHLCESCAKEYPECDATVDGIEFGSGVGNDNIIGCTAYVNRWTSRPDR